MKLMVNINRVAEFLFLGLGATYLAAYLSWRNNYYPFETEIFLRLADLPLGFFGLLLGLTSMRISLSEKFTNPEKAATAHFSFVDLFILFLAFSLFLGLVYVDLILPNRFPFPKL